tara:strand:- start:499 stop:801 length:303 start_codon:yes stop_codon:yes gene_type:complete
MVSLNALQFLCVKAGYASCSDAGTPHNGGTSTLKGDPKAIFVAWQEAKRMRLIPENDPIPVRALWHVATDQGFLSKRWPQDAKLPPVAYNNTLKHLEALP